MTETAVTSTARAAHDATIEVADDAKTQASAVAGSATTEAKAVAADARDQATQVLSTARGELRSQADSQAKTLSTTMSDLSRQLGDLAKGNGQPDSQMAQLAQAASDQLSKRADRMNQGGIDGVIGEVKRFARNRPGAFLASSIAAGFAVGRLAKHADLGSVVEHARGELDPESSPSGPSTTGVVPSGAPTGEFAHLAGSGASTPDALPPLPPTLGDAGSNGSTGAVKR